MLRVILISVLLAAIAPPTVLAACPTGVNASYEPCAPCTSQECAVVISEDMTENYVVDLDLILSSSEMEDVVDDGHIDFWVKAEPGTDFFAGVVVTDSGFDPDAIHLVTEDAVGSYGTTGTDGVESASEILTWAAPQSGFGSAVDIDTGVWCYISITGAVYTNPHIYVGFRV